MAETLAERQHTGIDPLRISLRKMTLNFGATMSATILKNRGNTPRGSTPPYESRSSSRQRRTEVRKAKELQTGRENRTKE